MTYAKYILNSDFSVSRQLLLLSETEPQGRTGFSAPLRLIIP
ncbi:hypothetical protein [Nostoc sp.]